jgi:hypothetical protein
VTAPARMAPEVSSRAREPRRRSLTAVAGLCFSLVAFAVTQVPMLFARSGNALSVFRDYHAQDQLSYFAIVVNGSQGLFGAVEPFTETGRNDYPRLYYVVLGALSRWTGASPVSTWVTVGLVLQGLLVLGIGVACWLVTHKPWTTFLAWTPFVVGTCSTLLSGDWFTQLDSHAVLWGLFGVLFTLNAEAGALCLAGLILLALIVAAHRQVSRRTWWVVGPACGAALGLLANVHTYTFLTTVYLVAYGTATYALTTRGTRTWAAVSLGLVPVTFVVGPLSADALGALAGLGVGLLPALPGLLVVLATYRLLVAVPALSVLLFAAPQVVGTLVRQHQGDPFLRYRVASSENLTVDAGTGIACAVVLLVPLVLIFVAGVRARDRCWIAYPAAFVLAWFMLSKNDLWGPEQEPYRFWIEAFGLCVVTVLPVGLAAVTAPSVRIRGSGRTRWRAIALAGTSALLVLSAVDWVVFYVKTEDTKGWTFTSPRSRALRAAAANAGDELILPDPCIDPRLLKASTGQRVAFFNEGMAWPTHKQEIQRLLHRRDQGRLPSVAELAAADVGWVLTDSRCGGSATWGNDSRSLRHAFTAGYGSGTATVNIELWRVNSVD